MAKLNIITQYHLKNQYYCVEVEAGSNEQKEK